MTSDNKAPLRRAKTKIRNSLSQAKHALSGSLFRHPNGRTAKAAATDGNTHQEKDILLYDRDDLLHHARRYRYNKQFADAVESLAQYLRRHPEDLEIHTELVHAAMDHSADRTAFRPYLEDTILQSEHSIELSRLLSQKLVEISDWDSALKCAKTVMGDRCTRIDKDDALPGKYSVTIHFDGPSYRVSFCRDFLPWGWLADRLFCFKDYLDTFVARNSVQGQVRFCLGDFPEGDDRQLTFCSENPAHRLIPDPIFVGSAGYRNLRKSFKARMLPFHQRRDELYWRGSLTGQAHTYSEIMQLPRIQFCLMANSRADFSGKLTNLNQFGPLLPTLHRLLDNLELCGEREDEKEHCTYRYVMDLDGNTNSWPGLWLRLYSGAVVFKLKSRYRQWYYDRLVDKENILLCDQLYPDLDEKLNWCRKNPRYAKQLAKQAQEVASELTIESEYPIFEKAVLDLCY